MRYKKIEEWFPSDNFTLELNALETVKSDYNTLVFAGPGAGKTELLAQRACFLLETNTCKFPKKILAISFKRDAAYNLKERVIKRCGEDLSRHFESLTFDAFAKLLLDRFKKGLPDGYHLNGEYEILLDENLILDNYKKRDLTYFNTTNRIQILEFHNAALPLVGNDEKSQLRKEVWNELINTNPSRLSFKMVMRLAELVINSNPKIKEFLQRTYNYIFLDEFQDTTLLQYDFLNSCFGNCDAIFTAVGDDKQRIMLWAGANPIIFNSYISDYKSKLISLTMNFRSAPKLVALQNYLITNLLNKTELVTPSEKWDIEKGESFVWVYKNPEHEMEHLFNKVSNWISHDGLNPRDICILVKQQLSVYAGDLIDYFNKNGIKARDENQLQDLLTEEIVVYITNVLFLLCDKKATDQKIEAINSLGNINTEFGDQQLLLLEKRLHQLIILLRKKIKSKEPIKDFGEIILEIINFANVDKIKTVYPIYRNQQYFKKILKQLNDELSKNYQEVNNLKSALNTLLGKDSIPVMTIHKSKGLEYHTIIFIGLEDGAFWSFEKQPDEDKCAFFVALSRAKERVAFTFSKTRKTRWGLRPQGIDKIRVFFEELQNSKLVKISTIE
ncbi:MAG: UvrD-helicase domain-containing protein [Desulfobacter sp.]